MKRFTKRAVDTMKAKVKGELGELSLDQRLSYLMEQISITDERFEELEQQIRAVVLMMSALVHHERYGGLRRHQINGLQRKITSLLLVNRVKSEYGKLSFLYDELDLVLSQVHRKNGDHWLASWRQGLVRRSNNVGGVGFNSLASAIRQLRLGHSDAAVADFALAETHFDSKSSWYVQSRLGRIKALRLGCQFDEALNLIWATDTGAWANGGQVEMQWEMALGQFLKSGDANPMAEFVKEHRSSQATGEYILEFRLWQLAFPEELKSIKAPKASTIYRHGRIELNRWKTLYQMVEGFENYFDTDIPMRLRLMAFGDNLALIANLLLIDHVLLSWAAAFRALSGKRQFELAELVGREYTALSLRLTNGRLADCLNLNIPAPASHEESPEESLELNFDQVG